MDKRGFAYLFSGACFLVASIALFIFGYLLPSILIGVLFLIYILMAIFALFKKAKKVTQ